MPITGAAILGGAGLVGNMVGSSKSSKGAAAAGQAEAQVSAQGLQMAQQGRQAAYNVAASAAVPSPQELNLMDQTVTNSMQGLQAQSQAINQGLQTLQSLSPAVQQAGQQTAAMLGGQTSALMKPVQDQQARQRVELQNQLASRLGPGYQTTAAGIMALNNFDNNAAMTTAQTQFQAFNQVSNAATSLASLSGNLAGNISAQGTQMSQNASNQQTAQQQLTMQSANLLAGGNAQVIGANNTLANNVGNQYAGQISQGQNMASLGAGVGQAGLTLGTMSAMSGSGGMSSDQSDFIDSVNSQTANPSSFSMPNSPVMANGGYTLGGFNFSGAATPTN